jgi:hypothetical protein
MPVRKTGAFRCIAFAGLEPSDPDPTAFPRHIPATSAEPERQKSCPAGGWPAPLKTRRLCFYAGLKREPPDRPPPGVPQGGSRPACRSERPPEAASTHPFPSTAVASTSAGVFPRCLLKRNLSGRQPVLRVIGYAKDRVYRRSAGCFATPILERLIFTQKGLPDLPRIS